MPRVMTKSVFDSPQSNIKTGLSDAEITKEEAPEVIDSEKETEDSESKSTDEEVSTESKDSQYSDIEQEALTRGWKSKDEFEGSPERWRDAPQFVDRTNMMDKIANQYKEIDSLKTSNEHLAEMINTLGKHSSEDRAEKVKSKQREAFESQDFEAFEKYNDEYSEIKNDAEKFSDYDRSKSKERIEPEAREFGQRNVRWFNEDTRENRVMKSFAIQEDNYLMREYPNMPLSDRLYKVEEAVKERFSDRFSSPRRNKPAPVTKKSPRQKTNGDVSYANSSPEIRQMIDKLMFNDHSGKLNKNDLAERMMAIEETQR